MSKTNPFIINNYLKPKYFCDRKEESALIIGKIIDQHNVMLLSRNGIGKTTLIKNVFYHLNKKKEYNGIYIDLSKTITLSHFIILFCTSLMDYFGNKSSKRVKELKFIISNEENDDPLVFLSHLTEEELIDKFNKILAVINSYSKQTVIAIDNFQIGELYSLKNFEDIILKSLFSYKKINIILSGTKNILSFESDQIIILDKIPEEIYKNFIIKMFKNTGKTIESDLVYEILNWTRSDPFATQLVCSKTWEHSKKKINVDLITKIFQQILIEYEIIFTDIRHLLSEYQWKLLKSIASEGIAVQITSASFIKKYELNAPSSVKTGLSALIEKEMVYKENNSYLVSNSILRHWLVSK